MALGCLAPTGTTLILPAAAPFDKVYVAGVYFPATPIGKEKAPLIVPANDLVTPRSEF